MTSYNTGYGSRKLQSGPLVSVFVKDSRNGDHTAFIASNEVKKSTAAAKHNHSTKIVVPVEYDVHNLSILVHGIDRFSGSCPG